jgi:hypothetical protein
MENFLEGGRKSFLFRDLHPNIFFGTASDRYAGWIGQVYSAGRYEKGITRRSHKVRDKTFNEETLPVESVTEYFEHFPLLEIDYTFYRLLLGKDGSPLRFSSVWLGRPSRILFTSKQAIMPVSINVNTENLKIMEFCV